MKITDPRSRFKTSRIDWLGVYCPISTLVAIWDAHVKDIVLLVSSWSPTQKVTCLHSNALTRWAGIYFDGSFFPYTTTKVQVGNTCFFWIRTLDPCGCGNTAYQVKSPALYLLSRWDMSKRTHSDSVTLHMHARHPSRQQYSGSGLWRLIVCGLTPIEPKKMIVWRLTSIEPKSITDMHDVHVLDMG